MKLRLRRLNALDFKLPLNLTTVRQRRSNEYDPISSHRKLDRGVITSRFDLVRVGKDRRHTRMRHVRFELQVRSGYSLSGSIRQSKHDRYEPNVRRLWKNFMREVDVYRRIVSLSATLHERKPDTNNN